MSFFLQWKILEKSAQGKIVQLTFLKMSGNVITDNANKNYYFLFCMKILQPPVITQLVYYFNLHTKKSIIKSINFSFYDIPVLQSEILKIPSNCYLTNFTIFIF